MFTTVCEERAILMEIDSSIFISVPTALDKLTGKPNENYGTADYAGTKRSGKGPDEIKHLIGNACSFWGTLGISQNPIEFVMSSTCFVGIPPASGYVLSEFDN